MTYCHFLKGGSSSFFSFHHLSGGNGLKSSNFYPGNVDTAALQGHENDPSVDSFLQLCPYQKTLCLSQKVFSLQKSSDPNWFLTTTIQLSKDPTIHTTTLHPKKNNHPIGPPNQHLNLRLSFLKFQLFFLHRLPKNRSQWRANLLAKNVTPSSLMENQSLYISLTQEKQWYMIYVSNCCTILLLQHRFVPLTFGQKGLSWCLEEIVFGGFGPWSCSLCDSKH